LGAFIVFEGGEGAGKTTQARALFNYLFRRGYRAILVREPGGTGIGDAVRRWLKGQPGLTPLAELLLFLTARAQLVQDVILPALRRGEVVVCDRYAASSLAYQGYGRGLDLQLIEHLNQEATQGLTPDLTVLLDIPVERGLARKGGTRGDLFERETPEFHQRIRRGYLELAARQPDRWLVVDGTLPRWRIARLVRERVLPLLGKSG
jgi:dTMP kinase